jgi:hypothetical protein
LDKYLLTAKLFIMKDIQLRGTKILFSLLLIMGFFSCNKDVSFNPASVVPAGKNELRVMLTDDPSIIFDSIFIDIQRLEVKVERADGTEHWDTLSIVPGIYNILRLQNGIDTLLGVGYVPDGRVEKLRLSLGDHNSVMKNGLSFPLTLHNNEHQFIIKIDDDVDEDDHDHLRLWLDFDGHNSIIRVHNNQFELRPRIGHFSHGHSGEVEGKIKPSAAFPVIVSAISGTDTLMAITDHDDGEFKIRGIQSSTVKIIIHPSNGYQDSVINNVAVSHGEDTHLGTITLHQ